MGGEGGARRQGKSFGRAYTSTGALPYRQGGFWGGCRAVSRIGGSAGCLAPWLSRGGIWLG